MGGGGGYMNSTPHWTIVCGVYFLDRVFHDVYLCKYYLGFMCPRWVYMLFLVKAIFSMPTQFGCLNCPFRSFMSVRGRKNGHASVCVGVSQRPDAYYMRAIFFLKYRKTEETTILHEHMSIILAQIEISNKIITFCTWYNTKCTLVETGPSVPTRKGL
jgi:hypothetical protein